MVMNKDLRKSVLLVGASGPVGIHIKKCLRSYNIDFKSLTTQKNPNDSSSFYWDPIDILSKNSDELSEYLSLISKGVSIYSIFGSLSSALNVLITRSLKDLAFPEPRL